MPHFAAVTAFHGFARNGQLIDLLTLISVYFSPHGGCTEAIVSASAGAQGSVLRCFTGALVAKALVEAHRRGIDVQLVLDKSQHGGKYGAADFTAHAGRPNVDRLQTCEGAQQNHAHRWRNVDHGFTQLHQSRRKARNAENLLVIRKESCDHQTESLVFTSQRLKQRAELPATKNLPIAVTCHARSAMFAVPRFKTGTATRKNREQARFTCADWRGGTGRRAGLKIQKLAILSDQL